MSKTREVMLDLAGLTLAPSQVHGAVRLVPLLRTGELAPLSLCREALHRPVAVAVEGHADHPSVAYCSYVPHAFVFEAHGKGVAASHGAQLAKRRDAKRMLQRKTGLVHRMAKRDDQGALRVLPLHLALEGFLALHFGGPDFMWPEYSRRVLSKGLSPRSEYAYSAHAVDGFDEALRTFELHPDQCGMLVFVADAFSSAFVASRPEDYRALHASLIEDMLCELIVRYSLVHTELQATRVSLDERRVQSFDDLVRELDAVTSTWSAYEAELTSGLFGRAVLSEEVNRVGPFVLERFRTDMALGLENYLGERIVDAKGELQYLKVLRLSEAQVRRAYLLMKLHENHWHLSATAQALCIKRAELIARLESAEFGYLLRDHVRGADEVIR